MTPQETIKNLKKLKSFHNGSYGTAIDMAIKALEQEPCEDAISRQAVLDMCKKEIEHISKNWQNYHSPSEAKLGFVYIATNIYDLPPVTPQQTWIPVSERLPEEYIHVLCQFTLNGMGECYLAHGVFHVVGGLVMTCNEVIAWMPLPQPYKAESEGDSE